MDLFHSSVPQSKFPYTKDLESKLKTDKNHTQVQVQLVNTFDLTSLTPHSLLAPWFLQPRSSSIVATSPGQPSKTLRGGVKVSMLCLPSVSHACICISLGLPGPLSPSEARAHPRETQSFFVTWVPPAKQVEDQDHCYECKGAQRQNRGGTSEWMDAVLVCAQNPSGHSAVAF